MTSPAAGIYCWGFRDWEEIRLENKESLGTLVVVMRPEDVGVGEF